MGKANQIVQWATANSGSVAPAGVRKESDVMVQVATAYEAVCDLAVTANGAGSETGYQVDFYAQYTNSSGAFETTPPTSRLHLLGSITVDVTTFPLRVTARNMQHMPAEYKIVAFSSAATDTVTVETIVRTDAP